jgi:hypothetical protein
LVVAPPALAQQIYAPRCSDSPIEFGLNFFDFVQTQNLTAEAAGDVFSHRFKQDTPFPELQKSIRNAASKYGLDEKDKPLRSRLVAPPTVETRQQEDVVTMVQMFASTRVGVIRQQVDLVCENDRWRVLRFSYDSAKRS